MNPLNPLIQLPLHLNWPFPNTRIRSRKLKNTGVKKTLALNVQDHNLKPEIQKQVLKCVVILQPLLSVASITEISDYYLLLFFFFLQYNKNSI